ncbi:terminase small subunit [Arthrobacter phage Altadena]|uniref:Terminase small subunit n=1 Tax=Arthrobacter phage Altadena TaxID=3059064 RepID=A0AA96HT56_9CAUD|nr:terminase small subunit [Arthrobacter phage Altadena]
MPRTSKRAIESARKKADSLAMREAGATLQQIADRHWSGHRANAHRAITEAMAELPAESVAEIRRLESARLDQMHLGAWTGARRGDDRAIASIIRIMERRAKLLGLDMPTQTEEVGNGIVHVHFDAAVKPGGMAAVELEVDPPVGS